jgi:hypothetical protein
VTPTFIRPSQSFAIWKDNSNFNMACMVDTSRLGGRGQIAVSEEKRGPILAPETSFTTGIKIVRMESKDETVTIS